MTLRATLFDMDGLLLDSEVLWHKAEVEIFGSLGVPLQDAEGRSTKGMYVAEVVKFWYEQFPWQGPSTDEVVDRLLARVGDLVETEGTLLPGATRALDLTGERGPLALASSTPMALIVRCLKHFGLLERFETIHSAEFEDYGKPHPGVFLSAALSLEIAPPACLVLEDSAAGVLAAKAATMTVIAVPVIEDRARPEFSIADLVLSSLEDLTPDWLDERFA
ncbi:MAG TPA: hexitol phosphatase HxpB [Acidimicrobiales bacterium]|nr:hexitol phosphatase HxpB [Acidimicrobiales bacterium]